ncbi:MAG: glycosyltransferase family 2 protein [Candidatus Aureabacteria bacterium]|nr:glycosyltransferase family 2 protein [Candidatus Auribacterota bacterium]
MKIHTLSVIIPLYNDEQIVEDCYRSVSAVLSRLQGERFSDYELIFVDDGSIDGTLQRLLPCCGHDPHTQVVELNQNYGQHAAFCAGFEAVEGDVIVTLDSDLQIHPDEIPALLDAMDSGHDLVSGIRMGRKDPFFKRTLPSRILNLLVDRMTGVRLRDWGCPTVAMRKPLVKEILRYGEMRRFLKPLAVKLARSVGEVELQHHPRIGGKSGYGILDLFELALDFITNFSRRPFQKVSLAGTGLFVLGIAGGILYFVFRLYAGVPLSNRAQALIVLMAGGGLQLMILGFLGEFIIRIYRKQNNLPFYTVREVHTAKGE